jgi:hypothetical protein
MINPLSLLRYPQLFCWGSVMAIAMKVSVPSPTYTAAIIFWEKIRRFHNAVLSSMNSATIKARSSRQA